MLLETGLFISMANSSVYGMFIYEHEFHSNKQGLLKISRENPSFIECYFRQMGLSDRHHVEDSSIDLTHLINV